MKEVPARRKRIDVLLVEDNPGDVRLVREAMRAAKMDVGLHVAVDGVDAMDFLFARGAHLDAPRPDLILLDLDLPKKNGYQVLMEVKGDPALRSIAVIVLTTSEDLSAVKSSYYLHANGYVLKPVGLDGFLKIVKSIDEFWLTVVKLPH